MKGIPSLLLLISLVGCTGESQFLPSGDAPILNIEGGQIQGVPSETKDVLVYRGIPYAAPPVGDLRWKKPQPVSPWDGVKVADSFCSPCYQAAHVVGSFYQKEFFFDGDPPYSEDCLYLNIWTPAPGKTEKKLPVAMWVHGGGYVAGWGFEPEMDGEAWAERGVILVTINYRLGIFGFLAHPELSADNPEGGSGNYGTLDQIAALSWIQNNIAHFGGDPENITIFGQSAGAHSIKQLVASPLSKDKVAKAILMSGGGLSKEESLMRSMALEDAETRGANIMAKGGYHTLPEMKSASTEAVFAALQAYGDSIQEWVRFGPVVDGQVVTQSFREAATSGSIAAIPYMIGATMDDIPYLADTEEIDAFCLSREDREGDCYAYQFARPLPGDESGAFHSSELWFVFHTLDRSWRPFTGGDAVLSGVMVDAWTNFATYGNPNRAGDTPWAAYTQENPAYMIFQLDDEGGEASEMGQPLPPSVEPMRF